MGFIENQVGLAQQVAKAKQAQNDLTTDTRWVQEQHAIEQANKVRGAQPQVQAPVSAFVDVEAERRLAQMLNERAAFDAKQREVRSKIAEQQFKINPVPFEIGVD